MDANTAARIRDHYLSIWEDFEVINYMDLTHAERAELWQMYCKEIRAVPDNSWCGPCVVEWFKELIVKYKAI